MKCSVCFSSSEPLIETLCHKCAVDALNTAQCQLAVTKVRLDLQTAQLKDLADTVDKGLNIPDMGQGPMHRLASQVAAMIGVIIEYKNEKTRN